VGNSVDKAIAALAERQRGYATRRQLLDLGLGAEAVKYRVRTGRLIAVYAGVYAVGHVPTSGADCAWAAVLACGPGALLSCGSAASLWRIDNRWRRPFEVTVSTGRHRRGIRIHRATSLTRRDVRRHLGIRVTSPARTILDVTPRLTDKVLTRAVNDLRVSRQLRLSDLAELLNRCSNKPGAGRLRHFVETPRGPTRSEFEDAFLALCARFDLPAAEVNTRAAGYEVDALFRAERLIVELDGWEYHGTREAFEDDRERDAATLAAGFQTIRITWERLRSDPAREAERLRVILSARRGSMRGGQT
jgi:very-short-patch-repair endonuclease